MADHLARNRRDWEELENLVRRARRWIGGLSPDEIDRLDVLYRRTAMHLAQSSTRTTDTGLIKYLNDLTAAAHAVIYLPPRRRFPTRFGRFLAHGFSQAVARTWKYHAVAAALIILGGLIGYYASLMNPLAAYAIMPAGEVRLAGATRGQLEEFLRYGHDQTGGVKFAFASFLFSHNLKVGLLSLATGILAAIPTVLLLIYNGMILGAFTAIHHAAGIHGEYWAWILPHGITELSAVALCGGVGLMLGRAVISPGMTSRRDGLKKAGAEAVRVIGGVAVMLLIAAVIESYVRQSTWSAAPRYILAAATFVFWSAYFTLGFILQHRSKAPIT